MNEKEKMKNDLEKFKRRLKLHQLLEQKQALINKKRDIFSDELNHLDPRDKEIGVPRSDYKGIRIKPTQDTLDVMKGKYR